MGALRRISMFTLTRIRFLRFTAASALGAVSLFSTPVSADEVLQNLGPVGPNETLLGRIGSMRIIAFLEGSSSGRCAVNVVAWETDADPDPSKSAKAVRVRIEPSQFVHISNALQESAHLQCGSNGATLAIIDIEALSASGIKAQPPLQPVKPSP
jgi:hypothetical protein